MDGGNLAQCNGFGGGLEDTESTESLYANKITLPVLLPASGHLVLLWRHEEARGAAKSSDITNVFRIS